MENTASKVPFKTLWRREILPALVLALLLPLIVFPFQTASEYIQRFLEWAPDLKTPVAYGASLLLLSSLALFQATLTSAMKVENEGTDLLLFALTRGVRPHWIKAIAVCFVTCLCSFLMGMALGGEAPCVYMGALLGAFLYSKLSKTRGHSLKEGIVEGAGAGFALAFMNPLAGFLMQFGFNRKRDHRYLLTLGVCLLSCLELALLRGLLLHTDDLTQMWRGFIYGGMELSLLSLSFSSLGDYWIFLLVPALCCFFSFVYVRLSGLLRSFWHRPDPLRFWTGILAGITSCLLLKSFLPEVLGTGASIIQNGAAFAEKGIGIVIVLFAVRFLFTEISIATPFAGGTIVPTLCLGSLIGSLCCSLFPGRFAPDQAQLICIIGALSFFAFTVKKPLAALALLISFAPGIIPFIAILPSFFLSSLWLLWKKQPSLAQSLAQADVSNGAKKDILFGHHLHSHFFHGDLFGDFFYDRNSNRLN